MISLQDAMDANNIIAIKATPKASKNIIDGWRDDADGNRWLHVKITTVPEDGKANKAIIKFLAKSWNIAPSSLNLQSGQNSRFKKLIYKE